VLYLVPVPIFSESLYGTAWGASLRGGSASIWVGVLTHRKSWREIRHINRFETSSCNYNYLLQTITLKGRETNHCFLHHQ